MVKENIKPDIKSFDKYVKSIEKENKHLKQEIYELNDLKELRKTFYDIIKNVEEYGQNYKKYIDQGVKTTQLYEENIKLKKEIKELKNVNKIPKSK